MAPRRLRLDAELVRRSAARSREHARELIEAGRVSVNRRTATKAATGVSVEDDIVVSADEQDAGYASRGGHKLAGALRDFAGLGLDVDGRRCLDAGASTGGFTDVLLRAGAREVVAVDVGYGQLVWSLRQDPRVVVRDRTNVRHLSLEDTDGPVQVVVGDLSFISLALVLDALIGVTEPDGDLVLMVKPQFEVGKERLGRGGVVRDPALRAEAVELLIEQADARGWGAVGVSVSDLPGPSGNVEFFVWLRRGPRTVSSQQVSAVVGVPSERVDP